MLSELEMSGGPPPTGNGFHSPAPASIFVDSPPSPLLQDHSVHRSYKDVLMANVEEQVSPPLPTIFPPWDTLDLLGYDRMVADLVEAAAELAFLIHDALGTGPFEEQWELDKLELLAALVERAGADAMEADCGEAWMPDPVVHTYSLVDNNVGLEGACKVDDRVSKAQMGALREDGLGVVAHIPTCPRISFNSSVRIKRKRRSWRGSNAKERKRTKQKRKRARKRASKFSTSEDTDVMALHPQFGLDSARHRLVSGIMEAKLRCPVGPLVGNLLQGLKEESFIRSFMEETNQLVFTEWNVGRDGFVGGRRRGSDEGDGASDWSFHCAPGGKPWLADPAALTIGFPDRVTVLSNFKFYEMGGNFPGGHSLAAAVLFKVTVCSKFKTNLMGGNLPGGSSHAAAHITFSDFIHFIGGENTRKIIWPPTSAISPHPSLQMGGVCHHPWNRYTYGDGGYLAWNYSGDGFIPRGLISMGEGVSSHPSSQGWPGDTALELSF